jgi:hypothetical protein
MATGLVEEGRRPYDSNLMKSIGSTRDILTLNNLSLSHIEIPFATSLKLSEFDVVD